MWHSIWYQNFINHDSFASLGRPGWGLLGVHGNRSRSAKSEQWFPYKAFIRLHLVRYYIKTNICKMIQFNITVQIMNAIYSTLGYTALLEMSVNIKSNRKSSFLLWCQSNSVDILICYIYLPYYSWVDNSADRVFIPRISFAQYSGSPVLTLNYTQCHI